MKHIYAPHRASYFNEPKERDCLFCRLISCNISCDPENLIIHRGKLSFVMLNKYPYNNAHTMVVPYKHSSHINDMDEAVILEVYSFLKIIENTLLNEYKAQGINIGINIREAAGAGIIDHLHYHILPRWIGDSNFMTSISNTRVIPEDFNISYKRIKKGFINNN